jgi:hypothetical protein
MLRPFYAIAEVDREEDHGIDLVATLLRREGIVLVAEDTFSVQVKTHTASSFVFKGDGIVWLRSLRLPYFPVVVNLDDATVAIYTLNQWHSVIHTSRVSRYVFLPGYETAEQDDFPLGEPLMQWSVIESLHPDFPKWAYSVIKPAVQIETINQRYGPVGRFYPLVGGTYYFNDRNDEGVAGEPPRVGKATEILTENRGLVNDTLLNVLGPFANNVLNTPGLESRGADLLTLRESFRRLGIDPDPENNWDAMASDMSEFAKQLERA